jgi:hypothetical protein
VTHPIEVQAAGEIESRDLGRFQMALGSLRTLAAVLDWLRGQNPPRRVAEIVTQDEYTHDVIVPWAERLFLAFDAT